MFPALLYLQFQSLRNKLWQRIRRLRRPRYLFGALAGAFYLLMMFGRTFMVVGERGVQPTLIPLPAIGTDVQEFIAAGALCAGLLLAWVIPHERAALIFSEAEIAFLFPAPIRRQTLIHYKLVRSQAAVLFTVLFLTVLARWSGGWAGALRRALGWWLLLSTVNLHLLGSSFARTILTERGLTPWRRRALVLAGAAAVLGAAVYWASGQVPAPAQKDLLNIGTIAAYLGRVAHSAPAIVLLAPFRWVVRPFLLSDDSRAFAQTLLPAVGMLAMHYLWVIRADVAFEEASLEASQRHARRAAAIHAGRWQDARPARRRRDPFALSPTGPPAVAILWKNLLSAGQMFNARIGLALLVWVVAMGSGLGLGAGRTAWPQVVGTVAGILAVWCVILGPQFVRLDFRRDLVAADLLKMYPVRGWQMALGELLAPALILTLVQWLLILLTALPFLGSQGGDWNDGSDVRTTHAAMAISAALVVGPLNLVSLLIPNAAALLLPAWFVSAPAGGGPRGIEVMGQRLIGVLAQFVALAVALFPATLTAFLVYTLAARPTLPPLLALPAAALTAALVFTSEAAGGLALLGYWFEAYDFSAEGAL